MVFCYKWQMTNCPGAALQTLLWRATRHLVIARMDGSGFVKHVANACRYHVLYNRLKVLLAPGEIGQWPLDVGEDYSPGIAREEKKIKSQSDNTNEWLTKS